MSQENGPGTLKRLLSSGWPTAALLAVLLVAFRQGTLARTRESGEDELATIAQVREKILESWVEDPLPRRERLRYGAAEGMAHELDPYSDFIPPEKKQRYEEDLTGEFGGLGILISMDKGQIVVTTPLEDTPAWNGGILPDDRIVEIDGKPVTFQGADEAKGKLRGKVGTKIRLLVSNSRRAKDAAIDLERALIEEKSVRSARLVDADAKVAYLHIAQFQEPTWKEFKRAAGELQAQGMSALVLDLRGNAGGFLETAIDIASCFLDPGETVVVTRGRVGKEDRKLARSGKDAPRIRVPVAILLDGESASASEVLSGALRGNGRATLVGTRSYGKGSVQTLFPIEDGKAKLKLTTQYFYAPYTPLRKIHRVAASERGQCPTCGGPVRRPGDPQSENDEWGLLPDIAVAIEQGLRRTLLQQEFDVEIEALRKKKDPAAPTLKPQAKVVRDPQLDAAVEHLRRVLDGKAKLGQAASGGDTAAVTTSGSGEAPVTPPGGG